MCARNRKNDRGQGSDPNGQTQHAVPPPDALSGLALIAESTRISFLKVMTRCEQLSHLSPAAIVLDDAANTCKHTLL